MSTYLRTKITMESEESGSKSHSHYLFPSSSPAVSFLCVDNYDMILADKIATKGEEIMPKFSEKSKKRDAVNTLLLPRLRSFSLPTFPV